MRIKEALIVEGKYDAARLRTVVDATVVETDGFRIFRQPEKKELICRLARQQGIVILTDCDAAGFVIRDRISSWLPPSVVKHAYSPVVPGKERRKSVPSKEGLLGVEGIAGEQLKEVLLRAGVTVEDESVSLKAPFLTPLRLYDDGLSGTENSARRREQLMQRLGLPRYLSAKRLTEVINALLTEQEYRCILEELKREETV